MKKTTEIEDADIGFVWGKNDQFHYLWSPSGDIRRVSEDTVTTLLEVARGEKSMDQLDEELRDHFDKLSEEGYLFDGPVFRVQPPEDFSLVGRFIAFLMLYIPIYSFSVYHSLQLHLQAYSTGGLPLTPLLLSALPLVLLAPIHEWGHYGYAKRHIETKVSFGLINGVVPSFKTDTTGTWMLTKRQRIWTNMRGPMLHMVSVLPLIVATFYYDSLLLLLLTISGCTLSIVALSPFYHGDGYLILMDVLDETNIKKRGIEHIRERKLSVFSLYSSLTYALPVVGSVVSFVSSTILFGTFLVPLAGLAFVGTLAYFEYGSGIDLTFVTHTPDWCNEIREEISDFSPAD